MANGPENPARPPLTTWKQIAAFFDRDVRTVQRWEKEEGLPVHRHLHHSKSSVYAYPEELQTWWRERGARLAAEAATASAPAVPSRRRIWATTAISAAILAAAMACIGLHRSSPRAAAAKGPGFPVVTLQSADKNSGFQQVNAADLNGDGKEDLVLRQQAGSAIRVLLGGNISHGNLQMSESTGIVILPRQRTYLRIGQMGDFNRDGIRDLVLHQELEEPESFQQASAAYILWGRRNWPRELVLAKDADVTLRMEWPENAALESCVGLDGSSDLNQDGIDDLILGASDYSPQGRRSAGASFLLWGRKKWPRQLEVISSADVAIQGSRMGEALTSYCGIGDLNGDGRPDFAAAATEHTLWMLQKRRGRIYVFLGRRDWRRVIDTNTTFDFRADGIWPYAGVSYPLLADVNGDARDDLIGAWPGGLSENKEHRGEVAIWFGGRTRPRTSTPGQADVRISGAGAGVGFGSAMAARDLDGDGIQDLVASQPGSGEIFLLYGRREWKRSGKLEEFTPVRLFQGETGIGVYPIRVSEMNGDGLPELLFASAPKAYERWSHSSERAWILKPQLTVQVDVRPDKPGEPNWVNFPGLVVVRIAGLRGDPIEAATLRVAGVAPERHVLEDYNGDGVPDLQLYFETGGMRLTPDTKRLTVAGRTRAGLPIAGSDAVVVVSMRKDARSKITAADGSHR